MFIIKRFRGKSMTDAWAEYQINRSQYDQRQSQSLVGVAQATRIFRLSLHNSFTFTLNDFFLDALCLLMLHENPTESFRL
jgi:hypothetical protein